MKLFLRYVDDIVRTVRGKPSCLLDAANSLHPNLQFTLEETNSEGNLPFLDLNKNVSQGRGVICSWYQKRTDTGTILNYRSCTSTQCKRSVMQGTVHRVLRSTSNWEQFNKAMETNRAQWLTISTLQIGPQMCQSVISGSLTLRNTKIRGFGMEFYFSKIRMEPVMLSFLATTENKKCKKERPN